MIIRTKGDVSIVLREITPVKKPQNWTRLVLAR